MSSRTSKVRLNKLLGLCKALPQVDISGDRDVAFKVRGRMFAWYLDNHHGDGVVSLCCLATFQQQQQLVGSAPDRYYVPAYFGTKGWVALRLDLPRVDWDEVVKLLVNAYCLQAPPRLAKQVAAR